MDEIYQAPLFKRVFASILDGSIVTLLAIGLFMLLVNGAVDVGFHNLDLKLQQYHLQEESSLFLVKKDGGGNFLEISLLEYDSNNQYEHLKFAKALHDYYCVYVSDNGLDEASFNQKYMGFDGDSLKNEIYSVASLSLDYTHYELRDEVVDVDSGKLVGKESGAAYYDAIKNFYMSESHGIYNLAVTGFTDGERFQNVTNTLEAIEHLEVMVCVAFSTLIFYSLPVLLNKQGETPFMHILSICFADSYGYQVKWKNKIIRAIVTPLLWASSVYLFGVPLLANIIVTFITKEKRSVIDLASNETAIDRKTSIIVAE